MLFIASATGLNAQKSDFGMWYEVSAEHKLVKKLRLDLESSIRTDENASNIELFYVEPGIKYKFNDYFSAGLYYRLIEKLESDSRYHARHRLFIQMKGELPINRFTLSARYRLQEQTKTYIEDPEDDFPQWYQRLRLELDYDIKGIPLKPYINTELHSLLFTANDIPVEKYRSMVGIEYTLHKKHTFGIEYIYNVSNVTKPAYMNILGLTYSIKL